MSERGLRRAFAKHHLEDLISKKSKNAGLLTKVSLGAIWEINKVIEMGGNTTHH
jgi:hypothetical protein